MLANACEKPNSGEPSANEPPASVSSASVLSASVSSASLKALGSQTLPNAPNAVVASDYCYQPERLSWTLRIFTLAVCVALLALLVTARFLTPEPSGFGTHQQLGLPPCTAIVLMGLPCPACGMTTSWAYTTRGNLIEAANSNAGGMLLALIAMAFLPASCYFFYRGKASKDGRFSLVLAICLVTAMTIALIQWLFRLLY